MGRLQVYKGITFLGSKTMFDLLLIVSRNREILQSDGLLDEITIDEYLYDVITSCKENPNEKHYLADDFFLMFERR